MAYSTSAAPDGNRALRACRAVSLHCVGRTLEQTGSHEIFLITILGMWPAVTLTCASRSKTSCHSLSEEK
jgi:hypothetical protein